MWMVRNDTKWAVPNHRKIIAISLSAGDLHRIKLLLSPCEADFCDESSNAVAADPLSTRGVEERDHDVIFTSPCFCASVHRAFGMGGGMATDHFCRQQAQIYHDVVNDSASATGNCRAGPAMPVSKRRIRANRDGREGLVKDRIARKLGA